MNTTHYKEPTEQKEKQKDGLLLDAISLRDYFAAKATDEDVKAMTELLREVSFLRILPEGWRSTCRYMHADAMLKAREA